MWLKEVAFWVLVLYMLAIYYNYDNRSRGKRLEDRCHWNGLITHFRVLRSVILTLDYLSGKIVFMIIDAFIYVIRFPFIFIGDIIFLSEFITNSITFYVLDIVLRNILSTPSMMLKHIWYTLLLLLNGVKRSKVCESVIDYNCRERMPGFPRFDVYEYFVLTFLLFAFFEKVRVLDSTLGKMFLATLCMPLVSYIFIPMCLCSSIIFFSIIIYIFAVCTLVLSSLELLLTLGRFYRYPKILPDGIKILYGKEESCCYICRDEDVSMVRLYFCGHLGCCVSCAGKIKQDSGLCPFCRAPIHMYLKVSDRGPFLSLIIYAFVISLSLLFLVIVHDIIPV